MIQEIRNQVIEIGSQYFKNDILNILLYEIDNYLNRYYLEYYFITTNQKSNTVQLELAILTNNSIVNYRLDNKGLDKDILLYKSICGVNERMELNSVKFSIYGQSNLRLQYQLFGNNSLEIMKNFSSNIQNKLI